MRDNVALRIARPDRLLQRQWCYRGSLPAAVMALMLAAPAMSGAQPSAATRRMVPQMNAPATQGSAATPRRKTVRRKAAITSAPAPVPPPAAPKPQWPVNDPPQQASVGWSAQGLSIDAKNSSLQQILNDIAAQTGVKIEGMNKDERVFGVYGPGQPRDVLSQLLEGTEYNVLMVGAGERGAPQQIVLSEKPAGGPQPNAPVPQGETYEPPMAPPYEPPPPTPQQQPPQMPPNQAPRTPQQILQEMQQRQLLMQRQMQEQQQRQQQQQ